MNVVFHDENSHAIGTPFHGGAQHGKPSAALSARKPLGNITNSSLQNVSFGVSQKDQVFGKSKAAASGAPREKPAGWWVEKPKPTTDEAFQRRRKRLDALCENPPEKAFGLTWEQQEERRLQTVDLEVSNRWRGIVQSWNMGPRMAESTGEMLKTIYGSGKPAPLLESPPCTPVRTTTSDFILDENNAEAFLPDDKICLDLTVFHDELVEDAR